jgi:hypothetical protein
MTKRLITLNSKILLSQPATATRDQTNLLVSLFQFIIRELTKDTFAKALTNHKKIFMFVPGVDLALSKNAEINFEKALPQIDALSKVLSIELLIT